MRVWSGEGEGLMSLVHTQWRSKRASEKEGTRRHLSLVVSGETESRSSEPQREEESV